MMSQIYEVMLPWKRCVNSISSSVLMMIQIYEVMLPWKRWVNSISSQKVLFLDSLFLFWTALKVKKDKHSWTIFFVCFFRRYIIKTVFVLLFNLLLCRENIELYLILIFFLNEQFLWQSFWYFTAPHNFDQRTLPLILIIDKLLDFWQVNAQNYAKGF